MLRKTLITMTLGTALLAAVVVASPGEFDREDYYERRGPMPFELLDLNGDGKVTADEHAQVRAERHQYRAGNGYRMRGLQQAPQFDQIDRDGNDAIDRDELDQWHAQRLQQRHAGRMPPWGR